MARRLQGKTSYTGDFAFTGNPASEDSQSSSSRGYSVRELIEYVNTLDRLVQSDPAFSNPVYAVRGDEVVFDWVLTDGAGNVNTFNNDLQINVNVTGSAEAVGASSLTLADGKATVVITDNVKEDVEVTIDAIEGLNTSDKVIIKFVDNEGEIPA